MIRDRTAAANQARGDHPADDRTDETSPRSALTHDERLDLEHRPFNTNGPAVFRESLTKHVAGLKAVTLFDCLHLSGAFADSTEVAALAAHALGRFGTVAPLPSLTGASVKHAAQRAAILADDLAGVRHTDLGASLELRRASGTVLDGLQGTWARFRQC
jgi:predicted butyrate kinase (DUF1464 family)